MYLGIDIGTSGIKTILSDGKQNIIAQANAVLKINQPKSLYSEQDPESWWTAVSDTLLALKKSNPKEMILVKSIGLAGQMHGAVLLDEKGLVLRPAILWNDGRATEECQEMEDLEPDLRNISGNIAFPGFTAPKLLWVAKHQPEIFVKVAKVLLPKDYIRYKMSGEYTTEMSDASGTLWLDVKNRQWSEKLLKATGLKLSQMPKLIEGLAQGGIVSDRVAKKFGFKSNVVIAGGAGDNAAGAIAIGAVSSGKAFLSLGTSGVIFLCNNTYKPMPESSVHTFCHAIPNLWHQMSVMLNGASCLTWVTKLTGTLNEATMLKAIENSTDKKNELIFLPYLTGERTPHNDANAKGVFFGMTPATDYIALGRAVLEGVSFAFADGLKAMLHTGAKIDKISVIGGGARSELWGQILADILGYDLTYHDDCEVGPALGAARLARLAITDENPNDICTAPPIKQIIKSNPDKQKYYALKLARFRRLYTILKPEFNHLGT